MDLTKEEQQFLESYYDLFQNEPGILDILSIEEKNELRNEIRANIEKSILDEEPSVSKIRFINRRYIKTAIAAAILTGIVFSLLFFYHSGTKVTNTEFVAAKPLEGKSKLQENKMIVAHQKENRVIFLPDGSKVILSPGSKLNYPSSFDGMGKREVFLNGQAFFDIKHNASRLFIVHTGKLETIVLGTAFNIKAIRGEKEITVTVTRGKVKVKDQLKILGTITPNQQITYNKEKATSVMKIVDANSFLDWQNQDLFIDNLTLSEAAKILEDQFKIKIIIKDSSIREQRFTATFPKDEKLEQALKSISIFNGVTYTYNNDKSEVIINNQKPKL
ncbi:MAG: FecR domain-containing protein [Bacteroidota bacterium]|nr:FecR domain-containing protein [Bacteroidota bacterium]